MRWRRGKEERDVQVLADDLVRESESYLLGRYPYDLRAHGHAVPGWAWISVLAHAPYALILEMAAGEGQGSTRDHSVRQWQPALSYLARELLAVSARTGRTIEELQHSVLLDLELGAARRPGQLDPRLLVGEVLNELEPYRGDRLS